MKTTTNLIYFCKPNDIVILRYISAYDAEQAKMNRIFCAHIHGYGYGFVITKLKTK